MNEFWLLLITNNNIKWRILAHGIDDTDTNIISSTPYITACIINNKHPKIMSIIVCIINSKPPKIMNASCNTLPEFYNVKQILLLLLRGG